MKTEQKLKTYLENIKKDNKSGKKINAILELFPESVLIKQAKEIDAKIAKGNAGKLAGKIITVKANLNCIGLKTNCASKTLENYNATYDATVIKKIKQQDGLIIGNCNMDEFACGASGETSAFKPTKNPHNQKLIPGGSSSGSSAAVAAGFCDLSLGSDTGGSLRNPASHCGVIGLKPTYSSVSRYGLLDLSMSLDQIGPVAKNIKDTGLLLSIIKGKDLRDSISQESPNIDLNNLEKIPKNITIGLLDLSNLNVDPKIKELIETKTQETCKRYNWKIKKIKIPHIELAISTYYPLVYVEFFSSTRKYDGRRYGLNIDKSAGPEVIRRIMGGYEISKEEHSGRYYHKALKAKNFFSEEFSKSFKEVDCIISPTVPKLPHEIGTDISVEEMYGYDVLTAPSNLAGNCAVSIPAGTIKSRINNKEIKIPTGLQINCDKFQDEKLLQIARAFEKLEE
ncbi:MAG: amidase family protein [Nanoarchaeota archaeon]